MAHGDPFKDIYELRDKVLALLEEENPNDIRSAEQQLSSRIYRCANQLCKLRQKQLDIQASIQNLQELESGLKRTVGALKTTVSRQKKAMNKHNYELLFTEEDEKKIVDKYWQQQLRLKKEAEKVDKQHTELVIKQEELAQAISDTDLALNSYYRLSDRERELFEHDRPFILEGVEKHGTLALAVKNDARITTKLRAIVYYADKHPAFKQDLEIAKSIFKENLDSTILERAIDGTVNPVFQKGEYIGDYAVKDNKLLVEVAKANLPEKYDRRAYAAQHPTAPTGNTINIVNYANADETKLGYVRDIGRVKDVDDTGRVKRITQEKKMLEFYENKEGAEVVIPAQEETIEAEVIDE